MFVEQDVTHISSEDNSLQNSQQGWEAELHLGFVKKQAKTVLAMRRHRGPLTIQRPFYPEGGLCHVYLLHPPGGVVAGDKLSINIEAASGAEALVTTPAAGKFYRSDGGQARQTVCLRIQQGAALEWLPQETIIFQGARLASQMNIELADDAHFIGWEILAFGRPASGEGFDAGEVQLNWRILRNGKPLYLEKMRLDAQAFASRWGLNRRSSCGTLFAYGATTVHLDAVRNLIGDSSIGENSIDKNQERQETLGPRGVTLIDDLLICRASDDKTEPVRRFFESVRAVIRQDIIRREIHAPRIWAT